MRKRTKEQIDAARKRSVMRIAMKPTGQLTARERSALRREAVENAVEVSRLGLVQEAVLAPFWNDLNEYIRSDFPILLDLPSNRAKIQLASLTVLQDLLDTGWDSEPGGCDAYAAICYAAIHPLCEELDKGYRQPEVSRRLIKEASKK